MANLISTQEVREEEVLVAFFDLTRFGQYARAHTDREVFDMLQAYFEFVGEVVTEGGGDVVKFIGDAGLLAFPGTCVNSGVMALKRLKEEGDAWLQDHGVSCRNVVKAHFGPVICGPLGTREDKRFDVCGETVNMAALLKTDSFAISAQTFRKLRKETRQHFKKHTPPVTYIPVAHQHRD